MEDQVFARTCQECGHVQAAVQPTYNPSNGYLYTKCRKCKSEALDFGHHGFRRTTGGKLIRVAIIDMEE
jgi:ribosomal protein S27E